MNRDTEILIEVEGHYGYLPRSEAYANVALDQGLLLTAVRGMASRARNSTDGTLALMRWHSENSVNTPNTERIKAIVRDSKDAISVHKKLIAKEPNKMYSAIFISDIHYPFADFHALELVYRVLEDVPNVAWVSAVNDFFNFGQMSHFSDNRKASERLPEEGVSSHVEVVAKAHHNTLLNVAGDDAMLIAIGGNHDYRPVTNNIENDTDEITEAYLMGELHKQGVLFDAPIRTRNVFEITPELYWTHGFFARSSGTAKANYERVKRAVLRKRADFTLVAGHSHRPDKYDESYVSGCLCDYNQHYLKAPANWKHGIIINEFNHEGLVNTYPVDIDLNDKGVYNTYRWGKHYTVTPHTYY